MSAATRIAFVAFALGSCISPDRDFEAYCAARGQRAVGDACGEGTACCSPYSCVNGTCQAAGGADAGAGGGTDAGADAGDAGKPPDGDDAGDAGPKPDAGPDAGPDGGGSFGCGDGGDIRLAFLSPEGSAPVGICSQPILVGLCDGGAGFASDASTEVHMAGAESQRFFSDSQCANEATTVLLDVGALSTRFHTMSTDPGGVTIQVGREAGMPEASQVFRFLPGRYLTFSPSISVDAGQCSPVVTIFVRDAFGTPIQVPANTVVALSVEGGEMSFFPPTSTCQVSPIPAVTIPAGGSSVGFKFLAPDAGLPTIHARTDAGFVSASQMVTIE